MSNWVHIRGIVELISNPHEFKGINPDRHWGSKDAYLPSPDEQIKFIDKEVYLFSLPRAKKYIDKAFELLPQGEVGYSYAISQTENNTYISGNMFDYPCDEEIFKQKYPEQKYSSINDVSSFILGIREDIRYASGEEMLEGLEKFFKYLIDNNIAIEDGYLEWEDEYIKYKEKNPYFYCWRKSRIGDVSIVYTFQKIAYKNNKVLWSKTYKYPKGRNGHYDFLSKKFITKEK